MCVCLSVHEHISGTTRAIIVNFFLHVAYGCGSVLLRQGDEIPMGRGQFWGVVRAIQKHCQSSLQPSLPGSQQKGSFNRQLRHAAEGIIQYARQAQTGIRKILSARRCGDCGLAAGKGVMGVHSAGDVYDCLVAHCNELMRRS